MPITLFNNTGVHCLVDGQFGSTGKGALAAWLAEKALGHTYFTGAIYSGGPNSGHTFYHNGKKHVLKQLPVFAVATTLMGGNCPAYLSAGAVINPTILFEEARRYPALKIYVHPNAAIVDQDAMETEQFSGAPDIASTMSGTGGALALKLARYPKAVWGGVNLMNLLPNITTTQHFLHPADNAYFMEVAQGFSLGINSEFYPYVTSRECTVMQGLADARIPPRHLARTYMTMRTFPIRVGGNSGGWYPDQDELTWEQLGQKPEYTTVTNRMRRVATFSWNQMDDAVAANDPDFVFINFLNYLGKEMHDVFLDKFKAQRDDYDKHFPIIGGYGPTSGDIYPID